MWICKKVTDKPHYLFNLIGDTDAKPNLQKPNAIMESRLTVLCAGVKTQGGIRQTLNTFPL